MFFQKAWFLHTYVVSLALAYSLALSPSPTHPLVLRCLNANPLPIYCLENSHLLFRI